MKKLLLFLWVFVGLMFSVQAVEKLEPLLEVHWLNENLASLDPVILDVRKQSEFEAGTIEGAITADYSKLKWRVDRDKLPGFLPPKDKLQDLVRFLGIEKDTPVVVLYGAEKKSDFGTAARIYWTLKLVGVENVSILNGGWKAWKSAGLPVGKGDSFPIPSDFEVGELNQAYYASMEEVQENVDNKRYLALDARPEDQFEGYVKHKASKSGGTIPDSVNLSQFSFLDENGALISKDEIQKRVGDLDLDPYDGVISFCNTGHWAATNWFVLSEILGRTTKLYDGSMVEWTASGKDLERTKNRFQIWFYEWTQG